MSVAGFQQKLRLRYLFFPNKGGQPSDTGFLNDAAVSACEEEGDELVHFAAAPFKAGERVTVKIDEKRRLDIMEQHTGEHLLSWCAYTLFDAANVGFHCALNYATLDLNKPLTPEQIDALETLANDTARENRAVTAAVYESEEALKELPLRKHAEGLAAPIRVVSIAGADKCTCCAPHVRCTGEIGLLKITEAVSYKGGMRLTFLCGGRALSYCRSLQGIVSAAAKGFSAGPEGILPAIEKLQEEVTALKKEKRALEGRLDGYLTEELKGKAQTVKKAALLVETVENIDPKRLRPLALSTLKENSLTLLLAPNGEQVSYVLCCKGLKLDMGECAGAVNTALEGKGGGRGELAQGSAPLTKDLPQRLEQLRFYLSRRLS